MGNNRTKNVAKYHKRAGKQYHLWLHSDNDADIIKHLDSVPNKQGFIKALIRDDIKRGYNEEARPAK
jgi:hypothetical protein